ncbi:AAA family ATPase [Brevibacillus fluminis]|uniref:AAA family ATPase n=1 Tax=Brevibacillus fluminis TaxID=511487 RepID=A0A3M8CWL1_9BACL|nr:sigma 54-interacting transcriptional regulator [Brevibacillus fluminis]RNB80216.1 AAA family ATPase [Brevibacillus fluminis]
MITKYLEQFSKLYEQLDGLIIVNRDGIIEFSAMFNIETKYIENEGFTGKYILDVFPTLNEKTSSHFRVMNSGNPIINERQLLTDITGDTFEFLNSTFPIEIQNEIIGTIEGSVILSINGEPIVRVQKESTHKQSGSNFYHLDDIVTADPAMMEMKEKIRKIAVENSPVLIYGETGTGKELVAQAVHSHSLRSAGPFISQNCSAIPNALLESTLFGTVKGSFTGAENRKGLFELADKGTLFLDEINSMDISIQAKILKAIEEKKIRRIGDEKEKEIDVRIVSAMNENPNKAMEEGAIRKDLYYRLGVIQINLPPLRERHEDIVLLTNQFIQKYNQKMGKRIEGVSEIVKNTFNNYAWPGNVRELKNALEHAMIVATGNTIALHDIPEHVLYTNKEKQKYFTKDTHENQSLTQKVEEYEKEIILEALAASKNITEAANMLQITRQSLQYKIDKYRLK